MTGLSPDSPTKYAGPNVFLAPTVTRSRRPTGADVKQPETGKNYLVSCIWQVGKNPTTGSEGEMWILTKIVANVAYWQAIGSGSPGPTIMFDVPLGTTPIEPDGTDTITLTSNGGTIDITGSTGGNPNFINFDLAGGTSIISEILIDDVGGAVTNPITPIANRVIINGSQVLQAGEPVQTFGDTAQNQFNIQVQITDESAVDDSTLNGLAHFNSTQFDVTLGGFVTLAGSTGPAATKFKPDTGTDPVVPTAGGQVSLLGGSTFATNTQANPIRTDGTGANTMSFEIQLAGSNAAVAGANKFGVAQFDANQFTVTSGYVQLSGGGMAVDSLKGDDGVAVGPDGSGIINVLGATVANATHAKALFSRNSAANTETWDIQLSTADTVAASTSAHAGICSFKTTDFNVDANGFVTSKGPVTPGVTNLGITYNAGTGVFAVTAADGSALSATNIAYVTLGSNLSPGKQITLPITANQSFIDDNGASQIIGNTFGTTAAVAWASACPFFIYAVLKEDDTAIAFMISRQPSRLRTNGSNIAKSGSAIASTQFDMFSLDSTITAANYDASICLRIGYMTMTKTALDDWTVQTLNVLQGIGTFPADNFDFPLHQNGAAVGSYFSSSVGGNTLPTFTGASYLYRFDEIGNVYIRFEADLCATSGIGAGILRLHVPTVIADGNTGSPPSSFSFVNGAGNYIQTQAVNNALSISYYQFFFVNSAGGALVTPAGILNTASVFACQIHYYGFSN